jgi:hypothetical protein
MSLTDMSPPLAGPEPDPALVEALAVAMDAHDAARDGAFPEAAWALLDAAGLAGFSTDGVPVADELAAVRTASRADVSLGRLLDGHLNGVQRRLVPVDPPGAGPELAAVRDGRLRVGVWGADPGPGEGEPARLLAGAAVLAVVKTYCSGAGGLQRAFVLARGPGDERPLRLAYVDLTAGTTVDRSWYGGEGMRGSASHRVCFDGAPVLWTADAPAALMAQPWFAQDGLRTAAGWAGGADAVVDGTLAVLRAKGGAGPVEELAVARLLAAGRATGLWLAAGAEAIEAGATDLADTTLLARGEIAGAVRTILDESSRVLGARPFATGGRIERARRDLLTYLLQHRLEPPLTALGRRTLDADPPA